MHGRRGEFGIKDAGQETQNQQSHPNIDNRRTATAENRAAIMKVVIVLACWTALALAVEVAQPVADLDLAAHRQGGYGGGHRGGYGGGHRGGYGGGYGYGYGRKRRSVEEIQAIAVPEFVVDTSADLDLAEHRRGGYGGGHHGGYGGGHHGGYGGGHHGGYGGGHHGGYGGGYGGGHHHHGWGRKRRSVDEMQEPVQIADQDVAEQFYGSYVNPVDQGVVAISADSGLFAISADQDVAEQRYGGYGGHGGYGGGYGGGHRGGHHRGGYGGYGHHG